MLGLASNKHYLQLAQVHVPVEDNQHKHLFHWKRTKITPLLHVPTIGSQEATGDKVTPTIALSSPTVLFFYKMYSGKGENPILKTTSTTQFPVSLFRNCN